MMNKYYKIVEKQSIVMFYHNSETDCLEGVIEELKTKTSHVLKKHFDTHFYTKVSENSLAQGMIKCAIEITKEEYDTAMAVLDSMLGDTDMFLDIHLAPKNNEVKADMSYI